MIITIILINIEIMIIQREHRSHSHVVLHSRYMSKDRSLFIYLCQVSLINIACSKSLCC